MARLKLVIFLVLLGVLFILPPGYGAVLYVAPTGDNTNGSSWAHAYTSVQRAIDAATAGTDIWVAAGTYLENITMKAKVSLYGGFTTDMTSMSQRNWKVNSSILDGHNAGSVVIVPSGIALDTRLDGFTIRGGKASYYGGGIRSFQSPTIANNIITANASGVDGGGIHSVGDAAIMNNVITANYAPDHGGGIYSIGPHSRIINNTIAENYAGEGGGIYYEGWAAVIQGNLIRNNTANGGAGIWRSVSSGDRIVCNTIVGNIARVKEAGVCGCTGAVVFVGNIIAQNSPDGFSYTGYISTQSGWNCVYANGNDSTCVSYNDTRMDPQFVGSGDYHLKSNSPCIGAVDPSYLEPGWPDLDGNPRVIGSRADMGAYESSCLQEITFSPDGGTFYDPKDVVVQCNVSGAQIHYTMDGSIPTEASPTIASGSSIRIDKNAVLCAKAWMDGTEYSVKQAAYNFSVIDPIIDPPGGTYDTIQDVSITCSTPGATIRYTTDGRWVTESSPILASGAKIRISETTHVEARAYMPGWTPSNEMRASYRLAPYDPVMDPPGGGL